MSRSFALERIRINVEIACEQMGDFLGSSFGALKKPLTMLAGLALIMTLRSARRGVQSMKGLTAGGHDATYKASAYNSNTKGTMYNPRTGSYGASSMRTNPPLRSSLSSSNGASTGGYGSSGYGSSTTGSSGSFSSTSTGGYGSTGGAGGGASQYNAGGSYNTGGAGGGGYGGNTASSLSSSSSSMYGGQQQQPPRALADLLDRHGASLLRVMDAHLFKDYGGVHEFYGMVETLQAYEGAGVVEKVLQSPGQGKVLIVDGGANLNVGVYGKVAAQAAKQNGWKGVVIHGAIRETKTILETAIGCKAMGTNPNRGRATTGSKGVALNIAGMQITSGMWIYADKDGIAFSDTELTVGPTGMSQQGGGPTVGAGGMGGGAQVGGYSGGGGASAYGGGGQQQQGTNSYGSGGGGGSQSGAYGSANTGYGSQMGGGTSNTGAYGSQQGGYGGGGGSSGSTYGGGSQQQQQQQGGGGYGQQATSSTYGASQGTSSTYGASQGTGTSGYGSAASNGANPYSHAAARRTSAASNREAGVSVAVYLSLLSALLIVPFELI